MYVRNMDGFILFSDSKQALVSTPGAIIDDLGLDFVEEANMIPTFRNGTLEWLAVTESEDNTFESIINQI